MDDQSLELYIQSCYTEYKLRWSEDKSEKLRLERGVSFSELLAARFIDDKSHPLKPHQRMFLVEFREYIWVIPLVVQNNEIFLKTAFKSRVQTKLWRAGWLQ
jgi:hypothetical protein